MTPELWLFTVGASLLALTVITRLYLATRAQSEARRALDALRQELSDAYRGRQERYRTMMQTPKGFEDEKACLSELMPHLEQRYQALAGLTMAEKFRPSFCTACRSLTAHARGKLRSLQDEAFWAQFQPGAIDDIRYGDR